MSLDLGPLKPDWQSGGVSLFEGDCLPLMRQMPDNSFDLIATDPPYFKVKGEAWDRQWDKPDQFIAWIGELCEQWQRILKPNGSLYVFASPQMRARVECKVGSYFATLPTITWNKGELPGGARHKAACKESLRSYFPASEAIIFAEHFNADNVAKGGSGEPFHFGPIVDYLRHERDAAGVSDGGMDVACGWRTQAFHYFARNASNFCLPTAQAYESMRRAFPGRFRREYEDLRREYEDLRRPFTVTADVPYTDVWTFPTVNAYPGKHPCEKPLAMMEHIVRASSREGARVLDCFVGSGATAEACINLGRECVGIDLDLSHALRRMDRVLNAEPLFEEAAA